MNYFSLEFLLSCQLSEPDHVSNLSLQGAKSTQVSSQLIYVCSYHTIFIHFFIVFVPVQDQEHDSGK